MRDLICLPSVGLYYINAYGQEIHPTPTPEYISGLGSHQVLVYSCGSLWTRFAFTTLSRKTQLRRKVAWEY